MTTITVARSHQNESTLAELFTVLRPESAVTVSGQERPRPLHAGLLGMGNKNSEIALDPMPGLIVDCEQPLASHKGRSGGSGGSSSVLENYMTPPDKLYHLHHHDVAYDMMAFSS